MAENDDVIIKDVELFRAGKYPQGDITEDDLDDIVKEFDDVGQDRPVTIDHEKTGQAYGWVTGLRRVGNILRGDLSLIKAFAKKVKERGFRHRSVEIPMRGPKRLRAVTFLGAGTPQVKGLKDLAFSDDEEVAYFDYEGDPNSDQRRRESDNDNEDSLATFAEVKRERGIEFPPRAFLFTPDLADPSTWKLRVWEDLEKKVTRRQLGLAAAAFAPGGFRGRRVQLPSNQVRTIKRRLRALYETLNVPDNQVPAQILNFVDDALVPGNYFDFYEESFALTPDLANPNTWGLRLFSDPNGDPDPKLVGQAIAHFSPGGFGEEGKKILPTDPGYISAKFAVIQACEQIGKDPAWADWKDSDILYDPAITMESLGKNRPDLITSFKEEYNLKQEESNMSNENEKLEAKEKEVKDLEAKFSDLEGQNKDLAKQVEETTAQFSKTNDELTEMKAETAKAARIEDLKTRVASAELPAKFSDNLIELFSDSENLDDLDARIETYKGFSEIAAPENHISDHSASESEHGSNDVVQRAHAYMKKNGGTIADAYIATELKS